MPPRMRKRAESMVTTAPGKKDLSLAVNFSRTAVGLVNCSYKNTAPVQQPTMVNTSSLTNHFRQAMPTPPFARRDSTVRRAKLQRGFEAGCSLSPCTQGERAG